MEEIYHLVVVVVVVVAAAAVVVVVVRVVVVIVLLLVVVAVAVLIPVALLSAAAHWLGLKFEYRCWQGCSSVMFIVRRVGSGLCDGLITRPEESYRVCVCV